MMNCKKALQEANGDMNPRRRAGASEGIPTGREKKAGRTAAEGSIGSYIHTGSPVVGVLLELNWRNRFFVAAVMSSRIAAHVAMQIAACSQHRIHQHRSDFQRRSLSAEKVIRNGPRRPRPVSPTR